MNTSPEPDRLKRWRLVLGGGEADGIGMELTGDGAALDRCLAQLYEPQERRTSRKGGLGSSAPTVARWLGDIRTFFPSSVVRVMQKDAMERLNLREMLMQPEMLAGLEPDVHLVATLISLQAVMPAKTRETARLVVRRVVDELMKKLDNPMRQAVTGALNRSVRNRRPRHREIDWDRTIRANLRHYQHELNTIIPETLVGFGRKRSSLRDIVLCIDQSGSMGASVVYSSIFGAVLASLPSVSTRLVVFDTSIVDLTDQLQDPVETLFGIQLGGGTDINRALAYCQERITRPTDTIFVLISDLIEGGVRNEMLKRAGQMVAAGVQVVTLLALCDDGAPCYDAENAAALASLGIPAFACTPDLFPDLMAAAIRRDDLGAWAAANDVVAARAAA